MSNKIIMYYQTFTGLKSVLIKKTPVTHIHVASIHFGVNDDGTPYIHLNDNSPYDIGFDSVWNELNQAKKLGIKIKLMVGGAGGGYSTLFSNFNLYYPLLAELIQQKPIISGIDLDVEEPVTLENIKLLIRTLKEEFKNTVTISMAPVQSSLQNDDPGLGGFSYKDLIQSPEGKCIDYFNVQFYSDFTFNAYEQIVSNGYLPEMIVMGAMAGEKNDSEIAKCVGKYKHSFGGVFVWEYCYAKPTPIGWANDMKKLIENHEKSKNTFLDLSIFFH